MHFMHKSGTSLWLCPGFRTAPSNEAATTGPGAALPVPLSSPGTHSDRHRFCVTGHRCLKRWHAVGHWLGQLQSHREGPFPHAPRRARRPGDVGVRGRAAGTPTASVRMAAAALPASAPLPAALHQDPSFFLQEEQHGHSRLAHGHRAWAIEGPRSCPPSDRRNQVSLMECGGGLDTAPWVWRGQVCGPGQGGSGTR